MDICSFALLTQAPNITSLQQELTTLLQHEWLPHINQRDYHAGSQGGWDVLALRCAEEYRVAHPILQAFSISAATDWDNLPSLESSPALLQFIHLLAQLNRCA